MASLQLFLLINCTSNKNDTPLVLIEIGNNLILLRERDTIPIQNPNFVVPNVRHVGQSLFEKIKQTTTPIQYFQFFSKPGDAKYPIGDGTASEILEIYDARTQKSFFIRLKYSKEENMYDILGYF